MEEMGSQAGGEQGKPRSQKNSRREKRGERWWLAAGPWGAPGGGHVKEQEKSCWTPVNWCEHRPVLGEASWFVIFTHQSIYFG